MEVDIVKRGEDWKVLRLEVGPYGNNVYILEHEKEKRAALIDAPFDAEKIISVLGSTSLKWILLTHAHPDHIQALQDLRNATGAPVGVHPGEPNSRDLNPEIWLEDGATLNIGRLELQVLHTPGHTPGSVSFVMDPHVVFCGDTLFPGGPGRTWTPQGFKEILKSIERLYELSDQVVLLPGHGPCTTIGESRLEYRRFLDRGVPEGLFGEVVWKGP